MGTAMGLWMEQWRATEMEPKLEVHFVMKKEIFEGTNGRDADGILEGCTEGTMVRKKVGPVEGKYDGHNNGEKDGVFERCFSGSKVGVLVDLAEEYSDGDTKGIKERKSDRHIEGTLHGARVGLVEG